MKLESVSTIHPIHYPGQRRQSGCYFSVKKAGHFGPYDIHLRVVEGVPLVIISKAEPARDGSPPPHVALPLTTVASFLVDESETGKKRKAPSKKKPAAKPAPSEEEAPPGATEASEGDE